MAWQLHSEDRLIEDLYVEARRRASIVERTDTLEGVLTRPETFALPASPLQMAIARAADGRAVDDVIDAERCYRYFGCAAEDLGQSVPTLVVVIAGVRGGKSLLASAAAVKSALNSDLSALRPDELARVAIVAPTVDNAEATYKLLVGSVQSSEVLRPLIEGKVKADTIELRRPVDGRRIEIVVVAASRGAVTLRSRWLAGFVLDEAALFGEEAIGAAITAEELLRAAEPRLLQGSQGWIISSPYGPQGLLWELHKAHFGRPGRFLVVHAPTWAMNPAFPKAQIEEIRARDPDTAAREYDAAWLDRTASLVSAADYDACIRDIRKWEPGLQYVAAMDPATRGNGWTLAIRTRRRTEDGKVADAIVFVQQWLGSKAIPLEPRRVWLEIREVLRQYRLTDIYSDSYGTDFAKQTAMDVGIGLIQRSMTADEKLSAYQNLATRMRMHEMEVPNDATLRSDLLSVRKLSRQGSVRIELANTPDGRHSDYAPTVMLAMAQPLEAPAMPDPPDMHDGDKHLVKLMAERERLSQQRGVQIGVGSRVNLQVPQLGRWR